MDGCKHLRKAIEYMPDARIRWDAGEDDRWLQACCKDCGAALLVPSDKAIETKRDERLKEHQDAGIEQQIRTRHRRKAGGRRLRISRSRDRDEGGPVS